jgi:hypothetical protein
MRVQREDSGSQKEAGDSGHSECWRHGLFSTEEDSSEQPQSMSPMHTRVRNNGK